MGVEKVHQQNGSSLRVPEFEKFRRHLPTGFAIPVELPTAWSEVLPRGSFPTPVLAETIRCPCCHL